MGNGNTEAKKRNQRNRILRELYNLPYPKPIPEFWKNITLGEAKWMVIMNTFPDPRVRATDVINLDEVDTVHSPYLIESIALVPKSSYRIWIIEETPIYEEVKREHPNVVG